MTELLTFGQEVHDHHGRSGQLRVIDPDGFLLFYGSFLEPTTT